MIFAASIVVIIALGWFVPRAVVKKLDGSLGILMGTGLALALGVAAIWAGSQIAGILDLGNPRSEFDRGFNAWKIMLLLAPASAIHARRQLQGSKTLSDGS